MKRFLIMPFRLARVLAVIAVLSSSIAIGQQVPAFASNCSPSEVDHYANQWVFDMYRGVYVDVTARLENHQLQTLGGGCLREYVLYIYTNDGSSMDHVYDNIRYWVCGTPQQSNPTQASNVHSLRDNDPGWPGAGYGSCGPQADDAGSYANNGNWNPYTANQLYVHF